MSDERMSDKKWNDLGADLVNNAGHHKPFDMLVSKLFVEARRARAREVELTARVEVLEATLTRIQADLVRMPLGLLTSSMQALCDAALTPPTPKETKR